MSNVVDATSFMAQLSSTGSTLATYIWGSAAIGLLAFVAFMGVRMIVKGFRGVAGR